MVTIYKDFLIVKNQFGYYEAHREDLDEFLYAKTLKQLKIEINEYTD